MKSCVVTFRLRDGEGSQTIPGVVDRRTGVPFQGKYFHFQSGNARLNTLAWRFNGGSPNASNEGFNFTYGFNTFLGGVSRAGCSCAAIGPLFVPISAVGSGSNGYSIIEASAGPFIGEQIFGHGHVTDSRVGEFDIDLVFGIAPPTRSGDDWIVTILGGDDFEVWLNPDDITPIIGGSQINLGFPPAGLFAPWMVLGAQNYPGTSTASGGLFSMGLGFTDVTGAAVAAGVHATPNAYVSRDDGSAAFVQVSDTVITDLSKVSSWQAAGYTVENATDYLGGAPIAFGGAGVIARCGSFAQNLAAGLQKFNCGIDARWLMLWCDGHPLSTDGTFGDDCNMSVGFAAAQDGSDQHSFWSGEPNNPPSSPVGARYMGSAEILRFGIANNGSTVFTSVGSLVSIAQNGDITLHWASADGVARNIQWAVLGIESPPPPPVTPVTYKIRRLRRFPLPFDRSFWVYLSRIEFLIQSGEGLPGAATVQGHDPLMEVRFSGDGGRTWGDWIVISMGEQGDFELRAVINRIGKLRNGLCEVVTNDPVYDYLLACYVDADENVS